MSAVYTTPAANLEISGEIPIVKLEQISHLRNRIKLAVMIYEEKLMGLFFRDHEISLQGFMNKAQEYFILSTEEALLFSRYLFERRNKPKVTVNSDKHNNFLSIGLCHRYQYFQKSQFYHSQTQRIYWKV